MDDEAMLPRTDEQWRGRLSPEAFAVLRQAATEPPFTGRYVDTDTDGLYHCAGCGNLLFDSGAKYHSGCGWPSFTQTVSPAAVELREDRSHGMIRVEVRCARCHGHLGHVFEDGPREAGGQRRGSWDTVPGLAVAEGCWMVQMAADRLLHVSGSRTHVLVLSEVDGPRALVLEIGGSEANAIVAGSRGHRGRRPTTHDVLVDVIDRMGGMVEGMVIHDMRDGIFIAQLDVATAYGVMEMDCRPSDGVAVAVRTGAPVWADESVLQEAAVDGHVLGLFDDEDEAEADGDDP